MGQYRKKPIVVEARQVTSGPEARDIGEWIGVNFIGAVNRGGGWMISFYDEDQRKVAVNQGDWVIKGVAGEFYSCKNDIFEQTYERVGDPSEGEM